MFTKNIDSIMKKVQKIVQELTDVKESISVKVDQKDQQVIKAAYERDQLIGERERATKLLTKWETMV